MSSQFPRIISVARWTCLLLVSVALVLPADAQQFTEWSAPENLGSSINTIYGEAGPFVSADGLSLYFNSNRPVDDPTCPGGRGVDIYSTD